MMSIQLARRRALKRTDKVTGHYNQIISDYHLKKMDGIGLWETIPRLQPRFRMS
jgi:hypothetical protein